MRPSSVSRIKPAGDRQGVADFSTGTMRIFALALTPSRSALHWLTPATTASA